MVQVLIHIECASSVNPEESCAFESPVVVKKKHIPTALAGWLIGPGYDFETAVDMARFWAGVLTRAMRRGRCESAKGDT